MALREFDIDEFLEQKYLAANGLSN